MTFGGQLDELASHRLLDVAFERGITFFDTANAYNGGASERILGAWLKGRRDRTVVATKVRYQVGTDPWSVGLSRRTVKTEVERSLARLGTDWIDILYLHQPDYETGMEETLRAVEDLIREGKVHVLGVSNFAAWQIVRAHWLAERGGLTPPLVVQPMYNLLSRRIEQELLPCCREFGLGVFVYNPLAAGLLTGKHNYGAGPAKGGRFDVLPYYVDRYWTESLFSAVTRLSVLAASINRSLISMSLTWLLRRPDITGIILGASSLEQLEENLNAFGDPLPEDALRECDAVWNVLRGASPQYNR